jgi:DNA-binding MarR family transcriptional regulator
LSKLHISSSLSLPIDAVTQTFGILAKRRAGKSYTARRIAEQFLKAGQQVAVVDPKGDWWGIRSSADGKSPGFPVIILGGERADVPLEVNGGEVVAKLVAEERVSVLLDLSLFRKHEVATFMGQFLENLYRLKARETFRTPMMLIIDEADAVAPQKPYKGEERMLGAAEDIVRRGGQRGIGCTLITQRSAVLNKNVLTQVQMLVALRTIAPQDLAALNAWIDVHGTEKQREKLMASLPALPTGDAWFWSPGWPTTEGIFQLVTVSPIETFDSGATPKPGQKRVEPKRAADVDLEALRRQMSATIERAKAEDPKELKKKIFELKRELEKRPEGGPAPKVETKIKEVPVLGAKERQVIARLEKVLSSLDFHQITHSLSIIRQKLIDPGLPRVDEMRGIFRRAPVAKVREPGPASPAREPRALPRNQRASVELDGTSRSSLGIGERRCAIAIAQHPNGVTREQLTTLTGYKRSTRNAYLKRLTKAGLVDENMRRFFINDSGIDWIGSDYQPLPTGVELQRYWLQTLPVGEAAVFQVALQHAGGISREEIGEQTNFKRSTRNAYLKRLAVRELVKISGDVVRPSETLFEAT